VTQAVRQMLRRVRRLTPLAVMLAVAALVVPGASLRTAPAMLVQVDTADGVDHSANVVWVLALGSDARVGEPPQRSRADAIQLVGINLRTGTGAVIGLPRDSWVPIPGHGSGRVNSALQLGGPQLMARTVTDLVGVRPDYVFTTTFTGFRSIVRGLGGVTVNSRLAFTDDNMAGNIHRGRNRLDGAEALFFGRARHFLPRGDFDRSANQQELLRAILREVRAHQDDPGFIERGVLSAATNLYTNLSPVELYRLAQAAVDIDPGRFKGCVVNGSLGTVGGADIVFPDVALARRVGNDVRNDARLDHGC
jgi:polyisoprenyl-teichoic acid--peptidoglycan teichoic acid transferase